MIDKTYDDYFIKNVSFQLHEQTHVQLDFAVRDENHFTL
jgi:hypothetical protein